MSKIAICRYRTSVAFKPPDPTEGFVRADLHKIFSECQRMARVSNGQEKLPKISTGWVGCTTDDRRNGDIAYSEREHEFTFAKRKGIGKREGKVEE